MHVCVTKLKTNNYNPVTRMIILSNWVLIGFSLMSTVELYRKNKTLVSYLLEQDDNSSHDTH